MLGIHTSLFRLQKCLLKVAASSALALSAVTCGITLSTTGAQAQVTPGVTSVSYTDIGVDFTDTIELVNGGTHTGIVDLELTGMLYPDAQKWVDIDYDPALTQNDTIIYRINKTGKLAGTQIPVKVWFDKVSLNLNGMPGQDPLILPTVKKEVFAVDPSTPGALPIATLMTDTAAGYIDASLPNMYSHLWIKDTVTPNGGSVDNVINDFRNVPGPFPILGAGAAFGFSRKVRSRVKAARTA
jgi:hypothetical protein